MTKRSFVSIFIVLLFSIWIGIEAFRSIQPVRGLTLFLMMIRNLLIFVMAGSLIESFENMELLNFFLFLFGALFAVINLLFFLVPLHDYDAIRSNQQLVIPGAVYMVHKNVLRLVGFARDPNFYSLWISIPFFAGFTLKRRHWIKWTGITLIGLTILLAASRSFLIGFCFSMILIILLKIIAHSGFSFFYERSHPYIKTILSVISLAALFEWFRLLKLGDSIPMISQRFNTEFFYTRLLAWKTLLEDGHGSFFLGTGLRGTEWILNDFYSHNSYLDIQIELGLIGLLLWIGLTIFATIQGIRKLKVDAYLPWIQCWFILLTMLFTFSLTYHPFYWLLCTILISPIKGKNEPA
ncbi:MAG: hypothetical protein HYT97_00610 [Elusimicrobia bacterium]|nr:hypothetical protein [Elusimicrobiota bacterium]